MNGSKQIKITVTVDADEWAKMARINPDSVPDDVALYLYELVRAHGLSYGHLVTDIDTTTRKSRKAVKMS